MQAKRSQSLSLLSIRFSSATQIDDSKSAVRSNEGGKIGDEPRWREDVMYISKFCKSSLSTGVSRTARVGSSDALQRNAVKFKRSSDYFLRVGE